MKKFKHLVIGGIESKILALVLISMLLVATVYSVSMVAQDDVLSHLSQETNERQLASMTGTTTEVIDSVIVQNMDRITELEASLTDELFRDRMVGVQIVGQRQCRSAEPVKGRFFLHGAAAGRIYTIDTHSKICII